jgi:hypothetical protein
MIPEVKEDIRSVLRKTIAILEQKEERDALEMKELSNHVIHDATLFEDKDAISVAVFVHALAKILEHSSNRMNYRDFSSLLKNCLHELEVNDLQGFHGIMRKLYTLTERYDSKLNLYATDVLHHAQIKKGCKVCEHGVSCAKSAELMDISQWDLMQYLGKTTHADIDADGHDIRTRLTFVRGLFP